MPEYSVDRNKWNALTIFEKMGNIYSEVGRSFKASNNHDTVAKEFAMTRALDLFDATSEGLVADKSPKLKEVLRAKEEYLSALFADDVVKQSAIDTYFMQFAVAARLQK